MFYGNSDYAEAVLRALRGATTEILFAIFRFPTYENRHSSPSEDIFFELVAAQKRGVKVRVLSNFEGFRLRCANNGLDAKRVPASRLLHAKAFIIDGKILLVGSHNFSKSAFSRNYEGSVATEEFGAIASATEWFNEIWSAV